MNTLTPEERAKHLTNEVVKEQSAKVLLNGVKGLFIEYSAELFEALKRSNHKDTEKREEIYRQLKSIDTVEAKLLEAIQTGSMAREQGDIVNDAWTDEDVLRAID